MDVGGDVVDCLAHAAEVVLHRLPQQFVVLVRDRGVREHELAELLGRIPGGMEAIETVDVQRAEAPLTESQQTRVVVHDEEVGHLLPQFADVLPDVVAELLVFGTKERADLSVASQDDFLERGRHGARPSVPHRRVEQDARWDAASLQVFSERAEHLRESVRLVYRWIAPRHNGATQGHGIDDAVTKQLLGITAEGLHILYERRHAKHHSIVVEATGHSWHPCESSQKNRQQTAPLRDGSYTLRTFQDHFSSKVNPSPSFAPFASQATRPDETRKTTSARLTGPTRLLCQIHTPDARRYKWLFRGRSHRWGMV